MTAKEKRELREDREAIREVIGRRVRGPGAQDHAGCRFCLLSLARGDSETCLNELIDSANCPLCRHLGCGCHHAIQEEADMDAQTIIDGLAALYLELGGTVDTLVRVL